MKTSIEVIGRGSSARRIAAALRLQAKNLKPGGPDLGKVTFRDIETQHAMAGSGTAPDFLLFLREGDECPAVVEHGDKP